MDGGSGVLHDQEVWPAGFLIISLFIRRKEVKRPFSRPCRHPLHKQVHHQLWPLGTVGTH